MSFIRRYILNRQEGSITLTGGGLSDTADFTVLNSTYVSIKKLGSDYGQSTSNDAENNGYLTVAAISATVIRVTFIRSGGGSGGSVIANFAILDLNPALVKSITRGQGSQTLGGSGVVVEHCDLSDLGTYWINPSPDGINRYNVSLADSTHVTQPYANSDVLVSWEIVEGY